MYFFCFFPPKKTNAKPALDRMQEKKTNKRKKGKIRA
jgi:hypothetical protein